MEKKVKITIKATQKAPGEMPQVMEFVTGGMMRQYGKKLCISYEESDMIGMEGVTTTFEIEGERVSIVRSGKLESRMDFVEGKKTESLYSLPFGAMLLGVTARRVYADVGEYGGAIDLEYTVEMDQQPLGVNTYDIKVETIEAGKKGDKA